MAQDRRQTIIHHPSITLSNPLPILNFFHDRKTMRILRDQLKYLGSIPCSPTIKSAIYRNNLRLLKREYRTNIAPFNQYHEAMLLEAAHQGSFTIVIFLLNECKYPAPQKMLNVVLKENQFPLLKWLAITGHISLENCYPLRDAPALLACEYGSVDVVKWLIQRKICFFFGEKDLKYNAIYRAYINRNRPVIEYLICEKKFLLNEINNSQAQNNLALAEFFNELLIFLQKEFSPAAFILKKHLQQIYPFNTAAFIQFLEPMFNFLPLKTIFSSMSRVDKNLNQFLHSNFFVRQKYHQYFVKDIHITNISQRNYYEKFKDEMAHFKPLEIKLIDACVRHDFTDFTKLNFCLKDFNFDYPKYRLFYLFLMHTERNYFLDYALKKEVDDYSNVHHFSYALRFNRLDVMKSYLQKYSDLKGNLQRYQLTGLCWAVSLGHTEIVNFFLEQNADIQIYSPLIKDNQKTPLDIAVCDQQPEVLKILLKAYAAFPNFKHTIKYPMIHAAKNGWLTIVQVLYEYDCNYANQKDTSGKTALLWAAQYGHADIIQFLLVKDRNLLKVQTQSKDDDNGKTPLHWALENNHDQAIRVLTTFTPIYELIEIYKPWTELPDQIIKKCYDFAQQTQVKFFNGTNVWLYLHTQMVNIQKEYKDSTINTVINMLDFILRKANDVTLRKIVSTLIEFCSEITDHFALIHYVFNVEDGKIELKITETNYRFLCEVERLAKPHHSLPLKKNQPH